MEKKEIRLRMAPSPTGLFHIGNARVFLFNWIVAKQQKGKLILRIEDTDKERSKIEYENDIIESLKWLGIDWDEGIDIGGEFGSYRQSERKEIYKKYLKQLIEEDKAYYCFCSSEELEEKKKKNIEEGKPIIYDECCRRVEKKEAEKRIENGEKFVIRLKMLDKKISFNDLIKGKIEVDLSLIGDIVIAKNFDFPLYNFVVVIDDYLMKISDVIRGEDHISNTPKQLAIYEAFNWESPRFAHLPLILSSDKSKMSKRHGSVSVSDYRKEGYLPEALFNFLIYLGWHPKEEIGKGIEEILSKEEIIKKFKIERVQSSGAIFNQEKLDWINGEYIKKLKEEEILEKTIPFLDNKFEKFINSEKLKKTILLQQLRLKKLSEINELIEYFFYLPDYNKKLLFWKNISEKELKDNLQFLHNKLSQLKENEFKEENLKNILMKEAEERGKGELLWSLRVALSGKEKSNTPFEIMEVLGKEEVLGRIKIGEGKIA
jgi:glutamyl-tRNA synthetase